MSEDAGWWRAHFTPVDSARHRCNDCGAVMDVRGGRPQKHLADAHAGKAPAPAEGAPGEPVAEMPEEVTQAADALEAGLEGLDRNTRLRNLLSLASETTAAVRDRVAAETLIAKYQGWLDAPPEEDEEENRLKYVSRFQKALGAKKEIQTRFRRLIRERELRTWLLRQVITNHEEMEWARNLLDRIEAEGYEAKGLSPPSKMAEAPPI